MLNTKFQYHLHMLKDTKAKNFSLVTPPSFQCYDCSGCGACCGGVFYVVVTPAEQERIKGQGWADDPEMAGGELFRKHDGRAVLNNRADGPCVFQNAAGLCRIHAKFGEAAKPLPCRLFPFMFNPLGKQVRLDLRFDCPAVAGNKGRAIPGHRQALLELLPLALPESAGEIAPAPFYDRIKLSWPQLCRITECFESIIVIPDLDITRKLLACVNMAALLRTPRLADMEGRKLSEFLKVVTDKVVEAARADLLPRAPANLGARQLFRQLLATYGRDDRINAKANIGERFKNNISMIMGFGVVPDLYPDFPTITFWEVDESFGIPDAAAAAALERYFHMRFTSLAFFGPFFFGRSYLEGLSALLLTAPFILWFARVDALGRKLTHIDAQAMERGIQIVDRRHGRIPFFKVPSEQFRLRYLADRATLRALLVWYGS
ncbi:MAG: YkgJ family cysteine cluster protein [bacterium]